MAPALTDDKDEEDSSDDEAKVLWRASKFGSHVGFVVGIMVEVGAHPVSADFFIHVR